MPPVQCEETLYPVVQVLWKIVFCIDVQARDDEFPFACRVRVDLWMSTQSHPLADAECPHAAFAIKAFGFVLVTLDAQLSERPVIVSVVSRMRHVDQVVVQADCKLIARRPLIHMRRGAADRRAALKIIPALPHDAARLERAYGAPHENGVAG